MDIMVVVSVINYLIYIISDYIYMSMYVESHIKVFYIYNIYIYIYIYMQSYIVYD